MRLRIRFSSILPYLFVLPIFFITSYFQLQRAGSFGCFDDCNNYMGGYFLLQGKKIFSEFFFNHQPLMAYISFIVQYIGHPDTIYKLVVYHRVALILFSFLWILFLTYRFRFAAVIFVLFYEPIKYYFFGNRFLAESFVIYPLCFMLGLLWYKFEKKHITLFDYVLSGISVWFVVFMREPYTLVVLFLFGILLWGKGQRKEKIIAVSVCALITGVTLMFTSIPDMILNIYTLNKQLIATETHELGLEGIGMLKPFFYPVVVLFSGQWNILRLFLIALSIALIVYVFILIKNKKYRVFGLILIISLGLSNLRPITPGVTYYQSFHSMVWVGMSLFALALLFVYFPNKNLKRICFSSLVIGLLVNCLYPGSYFRERVNKTEEFAIGYGQYYSNGEVIKTLAKKDSTLFLDGRDDLIYWQSGVRSKYKYSWYTSLMPSYKPYRDAKEEMFLEYPPDFYYGDCQKNDKEARSLPNYRRKDYQQFYFNSMPTCLYIKKTLIPTIPKKSLDEVSRTFEYSL